MKKFFVGLPIVFIWSIICLIAIIGFFWEVIDGGKFVPFAFITSIMLPLALEIILIILLCQYIVIDEEGIKKYIFKKKIVEYKWEDIKEIKIDMGAIYISLDFLKGEKKYWDKKRYIFIMYSDKAISTLKKYKKEWIIDNFNSL
ncbi:MAG: hypothetical protein ACI32E_07160 [Bacilli bacterium]